MCLPERRLHPYNHVEGGEPKLPNWKEKFTEIWLKELGVKDTDNIIRFISGVLEDQKERIREVYHMGYKDGSAKSGEAKRKAFMEGAVSEKERIRKAVERLSKPTWEVPEITDTMPDDPGVAADQMRIRTIESVLKIIDRGYVPSKEAEQVQQYKV
jgi:hypothetical protein